MYSLELFLGELKKWTYLNNLPFRMTFEPVSGVWIFKAGIHLCVYLLSFLAYSFKTNLIYYVQTKAIFRWIQSINLNEQSTS